MASQREQSTGPEPDKESHLSLLLSSTRTILPSTFSPPSDGLKAPPPSPVLPTATVAPALATSTKPKKKKKKAGSAPPDPIRDYDLVASTTLVAYEVLADSVCVACGHGVRRGERFVSPAPDKPFHRACFACLRCNVTISSTTEFNFCASTNRLLCKPCHETLVPAPTATPLDPLSIHCQSCSVQLKNACVARGIDGEMGLWCIRCAACRNCRLPFADADLTLQVLDELYCTRCSDAARLRLYNISRFGAGLIQPVPVRSNLPATSTYTDALGSSIFNFKHLSARSQLSNK